jgi:hypothetical protein
LVRAVNSQGQDTDWIQAELNESIPVIVDEVTYPHVVVNMSFAVVPCATSDDVEGSARYLVDLNDDGEVSLDDYILALGIINDVKASERGELMDLASFVTEPLDDVLLAYLECLGSGFGDCGGSTDTDSLVNIASSGNFGYDFPFFPAALPSVVSVSSLDAVSGGYSEERSSFSNAGEIAAPGALFVAASRTSGSITEIVGYAGTSFSAPNVSVFTALDLAMGTERICEPGGLAFAGDSSEDEDASDVPLDYAFDYFGSSSAIDDYCKSDE